MGNRRYSAAIKRPERKDLTWAERLMFALLGVFTIAYGKDASKDILGQIAQTTQAKSYEGTPENIVGVFKDISTFF